ncbi:phage holin family protein [Neisseria lisongii]|uniref:Phage holin family protein n=1 Tax=Neisseria lisongii TaxID=2912188 RepID=A0AAW5APV1_9NEIS|nr:phage holin family protein [Neisseria lisongii]MCF7529403.1 phage holin family protein [Neisseria lisongii]
MSIGETVRHGKILLNQGVDLLLLRLQLLSVNIAEQSEHAVRLAVYLVLALIFLFVGLISLLFGLNRILDDQTAVWVFFGIAALGVVLIIGVLAAIAGSWKNRSHAVSQTLSDMRTDIAYLRGEAEKEGEGE